VIAPEDAQRLLERAAMARQEAVRSLVTNAGTHAEREALAGALFRQYSCNLLEDLLRVAAPADNGESGWLRQQHDEQLLELGRELRDTFPEGEARHAVAQVIQRELLEAERRLKFALKLPGLAGCEQAAASSD